MSDEKRDQMARLIAGQPVPTPEYRYQSNWGKAGSVSASPPQNEQKKFQELQNFVLRNS